MNSRIRSQSEIVAEFEAYRKNRSKAFYASTDRRKNFIVDNIMHLVRAYVTEAGQIINPVRFVQALSNQIYADIVGVNVHGEVIAGEGHDRGILVKKLMDLQYEVCKYLIKKDDATRLSRIHTHFMQRSCCGILDCIINQHEDRSHIDNAPTQLRLYLQQFSNGPAVMRLFVELRLQIARLSNRHAKGLRRLYDFLLDKKNQIETKNNTTFKAEDWVSLQQAYNNFVDRYHPRGLVFAYQTIPPVKEARTVKAVKSESMAAPTSPTLFAGRKPADFMEMSMHSSGTLRPQISVTIRIKSR